jgi:ParB-like chromosome segregation protein Spo0J
MIDCEKFLFRFIALMQYDKIKTDFVNQGGLELLTSFIRDGDPNKQSDKQLEDVVNILWSCAINNPQAINTLQQDTKLMNRVNQLFDNTKDNENSPLKKAAEGLIWKVEKEEKFKQQQIEEAERKQQEKKRKAQETGTEEEDEEEEQYDCMVSYSWADMDLAHRIFHHLTEKLGYKVWLDQEQMHGSTIQAMV